MKIYWDYFNGIDHFMVDKWSDHFSQCTFCSDSIASWIWETMLNCSLAPPKIKYQNSQSKWSNARINATRIKSTFAMRIDSLPLLQSSIDRFNERIQQISNMSSFEIKLWRVSFFFLCLLRHFFSFFNVHLIPLIHPNWMDFFHDRAESNEVECCGSKIIFWSRMDHGLDLSLDVVCLYPNSDWIKH